MHINIFYSWQSDLPNKFNRSFIHECLEQAVKSLSNSEVFHIDIRVDKDTQNIEGAPDIVDTIFEKIKNSQIFVADISIINLFNDKETRKVPNPNVLLELGYAAASIGWENVLLIYNLDYGRIDDLPFDLKMRRPITYQLSDDSSNEKSLQKRNLVRALTSSIYEISKKSNIPEDHLMIHLYPFYLSRVTNIFVQCEAMLEKLCHFFKVEMPDAGINPPNRFEIESLIKEINLSIVTEEWDEDEEEDSYMSWPSTYIESNLKLILNDIRNDIKMLLEFKEGLNNKIISILGRLLSLNQKSQYLIYGELRFSIPNEDKTFFIRYYRLNAERFLALLIAAYELRITFKDNYSLHHEEYLKQEQNRFNNY